MFLNAAFRAAFPSPQGACNPGISWSIPLSMSVILGTTSVILVTLLIAAWKSILQDRLGVTVGLFLLFSGGLMNLWERLRYGCVHDFLPLPGGILNNPADWLISVGTILVIAFYRQKR